MINFFKIVFFKHTPAHVAAIELAEARLHLLAAYSSKDYATSIIDYRTSQISRLTRFLALELETSKGETK